jgi:hypothetical protein
MEKEALMDPETARLIAALQGRGQMRVNQVTAPRPDAASTIQSLMGLGQMRINDLNQLNNLNQIRQQGLGQTRVNANAPMPLPPGPIQPQ